MARSLQLGVTMPDGWYNTGTVAQIGGVTGIADCNGWQTNSGIVGGHWYWAANNWLYYAGCSGSHPFLCCD